jgi:hypothetical protein
VPSEPAHEPIEDTNAGASGAITERVRELPRSTLADLLRLLRQQLERPESPLLHRHRRIVSDRHPDLST